MPGINELRPVGDRIVHWGKHDGKKMSEVPTSYLIWFVKNAYEQMRDRKRWAEEELARRAVESINKK